MGNKNNSATVKHCKQSGFSLIELLASVVATGVIAATTLPIVESYANEADLGAIRYARAALAASLEVNHAFSQKTALSTLTIDGQAAVLHYGYPRADAMSISAYTTLSGYTLAQIDATRIAIRSPADLYCVVYQAASSADGQIQSAQLSEVLPIDTAMCGTVL